MGIMDHTRTWHLETSAAPTDCVRAVVDCLGGRSGAIVGSEWSVAVSGDDSSRTVVATYQGRAGVVGVLSMLSQRARREEAAAVGSQLTFTATVAGAGTTCTMAMTRVGKIAMFTADARFFRSAMNRVARRLRDNDAALDVVKR